GGDPNLRPCEGSALSFQLVVELLVASEDKSVGNPCRTGGDGGWEGAEGHGCPARAAGGNFKLAAVFDRHVGRPLDTLRPRRPAECSAAAFPAQRVAVRITGRTRN